MVKAMRIHKFGGPEVLKWEDVDLSEPGPSELLIRHNVTGFNFLDIQVRKGAYPVLPKLPAVLGTEAAGIVQQEQTAVREQKAA